MIEEPKAYVEALHGCVPAGTVIHTKLDLGCGTAKQPGFSGVDALPLAGVDVVADLRGAWPFPSESIEEARASHFIEHLTNLGDKYERVHFFNELWRVLKPGAKAQIVLPHWCSSRYYGDPTHKEPFSEWGFYYLNRDWRMKEAPATDSSNVPWGYSCDFDWTYGYGMSPAIMPRNEEFRQFALANYKEAASDLVATITKRG